MNNYEKDDVEIVWEQIDANEELRDYCYGYYWEHWWPENYINKRDVSEQAPEEMLEYLLETGRLRVFGDSVEIVQ